MNEKSQLIVKLKENKNFRASYVRAKINVNIPSQIRALRRRNNNMTQKQLAAAAEMAQPRISAMERPGATQFNVETLIRLAAAFKVGLIVKFASHGEMLHWENGFDQDTFDVATIDNDVEFAKTETEAATEVSVGPTSVTTQDKEFLNLRFTSWRMDSGLLPGAPPMETGLYLDRVSTKQETDFASLRSAGYRVLLQQSV